MGAPGWRAKQTPRARARERTLARDRAYRKRYGMSAQEVDALIEEQDGRCAICSRLLMSGRGGQAAAVDHCHTHGHVRGVLCQGCNKALGLLRDDPALLDAAKAYLLQGMAAVGLSENRTAKSQQAPRLAA